MVLKHKVGGWIFDVTRKRYDKIGALETLSHYDQIWLNHGAPSVEMYSLRFDTGCTHYLDSQQLDELYPYIGENEPTLEVLYGVKHE